MENKITNIEEVKKHKFIVIGGDAVNALGIIRSLGEVGIKTHVLGEWEHNHRAALSKSRYVESVDVAQGNDEIYRVLLEKYGNEVYKPFVFFTWEGHETFCDQHYDELSKHFYVYNAGSQGALNQLLSKTFQCELASSCGIRVPQYKVVPKCTLKHGIKYPIITKTVSSFIPSWKSDMIVCYDEQELQNAYEKIEADSVIIEEFIEGVCEVDLKGFSINNGQDIFFTHLKIWKKKEDKINLMHFEPCKDEEFKKRLAQLIQKASYNGIFDAEFIQDKEGNIFFLEVNWRTGMYNYNHTLEGVNLPYLWAKSTIEGHIDTSAIIVKPIKYIAFDEISSFADCLRHPKLLLYWWRQYRSADVLYFSNKLDPKPTRVFWRNMLRRKFAKLLKKL